MIGPHLFESCCGVEPPVAEITVVTHDPESFSPSSVLAKDRETAWRWVKSTSQQSEEVAFTNVCSCFVRVESKQEQTGVRMQRPFS